MKAYVSTIVHAATEQLGVFAVSPPPGWDASSSQGYPPPPPTPACKRLKLEHKNKPEITDQGCLPFGEKIRKFRFEIKW